MSKQEWNYKYQLTRNNIFQLDYMIKVNQKKLNTFLNPWLKEEIIKKIQRFKSFKKMYELQLKQLENLKKYGEI